MNCFHSIRNSDFVIRNYIIMKIATIIAIIVTLACAVYIMYNGLGLQKDLDFGAGAYFYADIPDYEKYDRSIETSVPTWVHIVLFLGWGFLMYRLWVWMEKRGKDQ